MDREIVGVGRTIQKKKLWKSISKLSRVLRLLTTDTEKKTVVRVEQNLTKFVFVTSTSKLKHGISLEHYENINGKGVSYPSSCHTFPSIFSYISTLSFLFSHFFYSYPSSIFSPLPLPFLSLILFSLSLSVFLIHCLLLTPFSSFPLFFSLSPLVVPFSPFLLCRSIPPPRKIKGARLKGVD